MDPKEAMATGCEHAWLIGDVEFQCDYPAVAEMRVFDAISDGPAAVYRLRVCAEHAAELRTTAAVLPELRLMEDQPITAAAVSAERGE